MQSSYRLEYMALPVTKTFLSNDLNRLLSLDTVGTKSIDPLDSSLRRLIDLADYLVDEHVGIVRYAQEVPIEVGSPDFFHFAAQACNTQAFSRQDNFGATGGASSDRDYAMAKAIGEAIERYCAALYELEELPLSTSQAAPFLHIHPYQIALYSREQYAQPDFPWVPFEKDTAVRWTPATNLATGNTVYVPAALVFVPYYFYRGSGDAPIIQPISTGLACHCSFTEAALAGIYEVIERDAFTITWQAQLAMPQLRVETLSDANYDFVQRFEKAGHKVTLLNLTLDAGIPTILSILTSEIPTAPALVFAAAVDLSPERAVRKSLEELAHTRRYSQQIMTRMPRLVLDPDHANVVDQLSHLNFWCDHANAQGADFMFAANERLAFDELADLSTGQPTQDLAIVVNKIRAINHEILIADVTTGDMQELGLNVVRALIPGFNPLFMGHHIRSLGGERLWSVPQKLGYPGVTRDTGDNPYPHPYP
jgi:ribosomal protein S12 methylthiotransferase accessory factor